MKLTKFLDKSVIAGVAVAQLQIQNWFTQNKGAESYLSNLILLSLYFEEDTEQLGPSRMAKYFGYSRGRVSQEISKLSKQGLISRALSLKSARNVNLKLSARGEKKAAEIIKKFSYLQNFIDKKIGESAAEDIAKKLNELAGHLRSL